MSLLDSLSDPLTWERFYSYKVPDHCPVLTAQHLREFIDSGAYLPVCDSIASGSRFALPKKAVISKMSTQKKRTVYTYPYNENTVMKLLTYLILREYDHRFTPNLYSFRPAKTVKDAIRFLCSVPGMDSMYAYKVDISNYFNSIPVPRLVPQIREVMASDPSLCTFLCSLLEEPDVMDGGAEVAEVKGIMAGTPTASFFANLYLREMDASFFSRGITYARYSDDIIVFAPSEEEVRSYAAEIRSYLESRGLSVNPSKESFFTPEEGWVFLGFSYRSGVVDIAPASVDKIKAKMRRKTRALKRWEKRNGKSAENSARAFIRIFNRKLFEKRDDNDLTWSLWYFPAINTVESLEVIDHYAQDCLRYLLSGRHTKARYNVRYEELKALGYKSLVHEYYA